MIQGVYCWNIDISDLNQNRRNELHWCQVRYSTRWPHKIWTDEWYSEHWQWVFTEWGPDHFLHLAKCEVMDESSAIKVFFFFFLLLLIETINCFWTYAIFFYRDISGWWSTTRTCGGTHWAGSSASSASLHKFSSWPRSWTVIRCTTILCPVSSLVVSRTKTSRNTGGYHNTFSH